MSKAVADVIRREIKNLKSERAKIERELNRHERALLLITTDNPNVGAGNVVRVRATTKNGTSVKEPAASEPSVPNPPTDPPVPATPGPVSAPVSAVGADGRVEGQPEWAVRRIGNGMWLDQIGLTENHRVLLGLVIKAPANFKKDYARIMKKENIDPSVAKLKEVGFISVNATKNAKGISSLLLRPTAVGIEYANTENLKQEIKELRISVGNGVIQ